MKKNLKIAFLLIILCIFSYGCQSVSDGLTLKKKDSSKQFLIEKKQPLVMPPDFDEMPTPGNINAKEQQTNKSDKNTDLEKLIESAKNSDTSSKKDNGLSQEIKKKINKKLSK